MSFGLEFDLFELLEGTLRYFFDINIILIKMVFLFFAPPLADLTPNYDFENYKFFEARSTDPLLLSCGSAGAQKLRWYALQRKKNPSKIGQKIRIIMSLFSLIPPEFVGNHREKNGTDVTKLASLHGRHQINEKEHNLIITDTVPEDAGLYTCSVPGDSAKIEVIGA